MVGLLYESYPWQLVLDTRAVACLSVLTLLQGIRYWCMATLGSQWNTRIILIPGNSIKKSGPYRYVRHPNYIVVTLEFIFIPLLMHAPVSLLVFSGLNLFVLLKRIRLEETALRTFTDYNDKFPPTADTPHCR
jgi:methyltransferase